MIEHSSFYNNLLKNINKQKSFTITGLTSYSRLLLLKLIKQFSNKKILFIVSTEQSGLKYSADLERIWGIQSSLLPYQNTSLYETLQANLYDYQKQLEILHTKPEIIITPIKILTEKFPSREFFVENELYL